MKNYIKNISIFIIGIVTCISLLNLTHHAMALVPGSNQIVSKTYAGGVANNDSYSSLLSANGKVIVFRSDSTIILPTGGAGFFVKNLASGSIKRVNVSTSGVIDNDPGSTFVTNISATGRYILFVSRATNLIDGQSIISNVNQIYLRDTDLSTTTLIGSTATGGLSNATNINANGVTSDGRFVTFNTNATNLHPDATDGNSHIYMLDRSNNSMSILDRKSDGTVSSGINNMTSDSVSCDGSFVVYGGSGYIVGDAPNTHMDIYLLDRRGVSDKLTNITKQANGIAKEAVISCNGDFIGFGSTATNLDPSSTVTFNSNNTHPYVYDRVYNEYDYVAMSTSNTPVDSALCGTGSTITKCISVSDTGLSAFNTNNSLIAGVTGNQVYIHDIYTNTTELLSRDSNGIAGNGSSGGRSISSDGRIVTYSSSANNLVVGDTNGKMDVLTSLTGN